MASRDTDPAARRLAIAAVLFALFIVFDIVLFGLLIFRSLSAREIEEMLLETRAEAVPLASELEARAKSMGQSDLWVVVSVVSESEEAKSRIRALLSQGEINRRLEIRDREGRVIFQEETQEIYGDAEVPRVEAIGGVDGLGVPGGAPIPALREVEVPIADLGKIVIGLSSEELEQRVGVLRQDLIRQTSLIGVLTLTLLVAAFVVIWILFRRGRRLEKQAVEAEQMAYIGTLASGLAHEIRNPLNSLKLNMQMLEEDVRELGTSGSQVKLLSLTRSELGRLERLAADFLSYARPRPLEVETLPAVELLERVLGVMGGEIRARGAVAEVEDHGAGVQVRVDSGQMTQLLINLTQNALAAVPSDRIPRIRLVARRQGPHAVLEVADNGTGIPETERERIFDLFFSTRKGGTGLGLAIVRRIAEAHDAEIEVESTEGAGTTLRLRLAAAEIGSVPLRRRAEVA